MYRLTKAPKLSLLFFNGNRIPVSLQNVVTWRPSGSMSTFEKIRVSIVLLMSENVPLLIHFGACFLWNHQSHWNSGDESKLKFHKTFYWLQAFLFSLFFATIKSITLPFSSMCPSFYLLTCNVVAFVITVWLPLVFCWIKHLYAQKMITDIITQLTIFLQNFVKILS